MKLNGAIENDDWVAKAVELLAETTADEVPAEDEGAEADSGEETAAAKPAAKAKPAKKVKKS